MQSSRHWAKCCNLLLLGFWCLPGCELCFLSAWQCGYSLLSLCTASWWGNKTARFIIEKSVQYSLKRVRQFMFKCSPSTTRRYLRIYSGGGLHTPVPDTKSSMRNSNSEGGGVVFWVSSDPKSPHPPLEITVWAKSGLGVGILGELKFMIHDNFQIPGGWRSSTQNITFWEILTTFLPPLDQA